MQRKDRFYFYISLFECLEDFVPGEQLKELLMNEMRSKSMKKNHKTLESLSYKLLVSVRVYSHQKERKKGKKGGKEKGKEAGRNEEKEKQERRPFKCHLHEEESGILTTFFLRP